MKTKFYLGALCLPLAFAACTNEEFESQITPSLENRGSIDVVLTAEKPAVGADTRMSIDENNKFLWEAGKDMIGAALVDGASAGTVGDKIYVNYPFVADADGQTSTFTGKSSMTQGLYFFYYGYQDVLDRGNLPLNMPVQEYDPASEKTAIQQASNYMKMISPIVNLEEGVKYAEVDQYSLNLAFANLYTLVKVNISSENIPAGVTPSVTKITLDGNSGSSSTFVSKANAKLAASTGIADITPLELTKEGTLDADELAVALEELEKMIVAGTIYDGTGKECAASVLNVKEGCNLSSDSEVSLYILAPKGKYTNLILTVETSEGAYTRTITKSAGIDLGNNIQPIAAELDFAQDGTGNVILPEEFTIASAEEWTSAVEFMTSHAVGYLNKTVEFELTKDIAIDNLPVFNLKITGSGKTLTLKKDYTINANNAAQFENSEVTLGVAEGATLTVAADPTSFAAIVNNGTLNVTSTSVSKKITNLGQMNINADAVFSAGIDNGQAEDKLSTPNKPEISGTINIAKGKTATISSTKLDNIVGDVNIDADAILKISVASENKGTITINGKLQNNSSESITNTGTIDNYGTLACPVTNTDGKIIVEKNSISAKTAATITNGSVVVVDVTTFSALQNSADRDAQKYHFSSATVTTEVNNAVEYKAADIDVINNITLNGGEWTLDDATGTTTTSKVIAAPTKASSLTLKAATLKGNAKTLTGKAISVEGASSIVGTATITTCNLNMVEGSSLTVGNGVTVNAAESANAQTATINGSLTVKAGAKMYFNEVTVNEKGKVVVEGDLNANVNCAEFGVKGTFTNKGYVESSAAVEKNGDEGKVSLPTNEATGTFKGNSTTISFN